MYTLAIDVGGTKIAAGVLNDNEEWLCKVKIKSDTATASSMYDSLLESMDAAISQAALSQTQIAKIGIAIPGKIDREHGIAIYQNNLPWRNFPLRDELMKLFPKAEIIVEHDVAAATIGEWSVRKLRDELFVYITVSTGIAASMIHEGHPLRGMGLAGEIGFFPVDEKGNVETTASGSAMEKELNHLFNHSLTLQEAFFHWEEGDEGLNVYFEKKASILASAIFHVTAMLDPHKIVLGGGVMNQQPKFYQLILNHYQGLCTHPMQKEWPSRIEKSLLLGDSGLYGAAMAK